VTPLVDVILTPLILFTATASILASDIKVNLPSVGTADPLEA
jgi:biopolymer transport protein ExbD